MSTVHRRDITNEDFVKLAKFSRALETLNGSGKWFSWDLGEVVMRLPVWYQTSTGWQLANYKNFKRDAIGMLVPDFRHICRYIRVSEFSMIDTLYRMSMISMVPGQSYSGARKFKLSFPNLPVGLWRLEPTAVHGYVIERRRAEGNFRK